MCILWRGDARSAKRIEMQETPNRNQPQGWGSRSKTVVKSWAAAGTDRKVKGVVGWYFKGKYSCTCHKQFALSMSTIWLLSVERWALSTHGKHQSYSWSRRTSFPFQVPSSHDPLTYYRAASVSQHAFAWTLTTGNQRRSVVLPVRVNPSRHSSK